MGRKKQKKESNELENISKSNIGKRNRNRGHKYELKLVKELQEITGNGHICTSRSESKSLDNDKIDIADPDNVLDFYVQAKATKATPPIKKIFNTVGRTDKPLSIFWNVQESREHKQISVAEYVIIPKEFFYNLIKLKYET